MFLKLILTGKKRITGIFSVLVSASILAWIFSRMDFSVAKGLIRNASTAYLLAAVLITCFIPAAAILRWYGVLRAQDRKPRFSAVIRAVLMSVVVNSFTPSHGGDAVKVLYLKKYGGIAAGLGTIVLERFVDLFVLGLLAIAGFLISKAAFGLIAGLILVCGVVTGLLIILFISPERLPVPEKIKAKLENFPRVFKKWIKSPASITQTITASVCVWSFAGTSAVFLSAAFDTGIPAGYMLAVFPACIIAGLLPVTLSGIGTRDAAFIYFLTAAGAPIEKAAMIGLGYTILAYWVTTLISLPAVGWQAVLFLKKEKVS